MTIRFFCLFVSLFISVVSAAQEHDHEHDDDDHHVHDLNPYEVGVSNGVVYNATEKEFAYVAHAHFIKLVGKNHLFGLGVGYERIFDEHQHNALNVIFHYRPGDHWAVNLAPGIVWLSSEKKSAKPALHIEGLYEFETGRFHLGPIFGISFNPEDFHVSLGLHLAFGF